MQLQCLGTIALALSCVACTKPSSRLEIAVEGNGVTSPAAGSHAYESGASVKVTAIPVEGATFTGWTGAASGAVNPVAVVAQGVQRLVAHFSPAGSGDGGIGPSDGGSSDDGGSSNDGGSPSDGCPSSSAGGVTVSISAGGPGSGDFIADAYHSGGSTYSTTNEIDTSLITCDPPPASVFQTERYGDFTYTIPNRTPGSAQTVTLYFQESLWTEAGQRTFDVSINGATVLSAFDIFAEAGGQNRAIAKTFSATADADGRVVVRFIATGADKPKVCGITVAGAGTAPQPATVTGPCDLYEAGGTPCVAAHSTVRALYGAYGGSLYQVRRASDMATKDIGLLSPGGYADSAAQDSFCSGTTCTISTIYDQSPNGNHLTRSPPGGWLHNGGLEADATAAKMRVNGHTVYGVYTTSNWDNEVGAVGYRNNKTKGVATGDDPEAMYMVASGKHYNQWCCFDYGNAETNNLDNGPATMEAVYFGSSTQWGKGSGTGPWVMADLEDGVFAGGSFAAPPTNTSLTAEYVTAMLKGDSGDHFVLKGGDAQSGSLITLYDGARPSGYSPQKKEGAIILGTGGDNSHTGEGTFFEGCMTSGFPSDATDDAVQANIAAAGYGL